MFVCVLNCFANLECGHSLATECTALATFVANTKFSPLRYDRSCVRYCVVAKEIKPKRELVAKLEKDYYLGKRELERIEKELKELSDLLAELGAK